MKKYILMFAVVAAMSACTEYPDAVPTPDVPKDIYTTLEAEAGEDISRTTLDGTDGISIHWNAGDQIYVWPEGGTTGVAYKTTNGGHRRALFGAAAEAPKDGNIYSVYPYTQVPVYEYDKDGNITNTTYVNNIKSVVNSKVTLDLGNKVPGTTNTYGQYCEGDISENGTFVYSSDKRSHYDVLYGSTYYDGYNTVKFKHAFSAIRLVIPKTGWYNENPGLADGYLSAYSELISKNPTTARLELDYVQIDFPEGTNVCGEVTIDAKDGSCTATSNSLRIYTSGSNSLEDHVYWGFFYAPKGEVEFDMTVKGTIVINDGQSFPVTAYTRTRKATFQNGHVRTVNLSVKDFTIDPVAENEEVNTTYFDLNGSLTSLDQTKYGFRTYANWTNYLYDTPVASMKGWYFDCCELANTDNTVNPWGNENSAVLDYDRIRMVRELNNNNAAAFCTAPIVLPEGVESATATVTFDLMWDAMDTGSSYVYVANIAGDTQNGDGTVYSAVKGNADKTITVSKGSFGLSISDKAAAGQSATFTIANGDRIGFAYQLDNLITDWMDDFDVLHRMTVYNLKIEISYTNTISTPGYVF